MKTEQHTSLLIWKNLLLIFFLFGSCIHSLIAQNSTDLQDSMLSQMESRIDSARENADFGALADALYEHALLQKDRTYRIDHVLDDLKQSAIYYRYRKDTIGFHKARVALAEIYIINKKFYNEAIRILEDTKTYFIDKKEKRELVKILSLMSMAHEQRQDYEKALENINLALDLNKDLKDTLLEANYTVTMARLQDAMGHVEDAIDLGKGNLIRSESLGDPNLSATIATDIAKSYYKLEELDSSLIFLNIADSLVSTNTYLRIGIDELYADIHEAQENAGEALYYTIKYNRLKDSLNEIRYIDQINKFKIEYQAADNRNKILSLEKEQELKEVKLIQKNRLLIALALGMLAGLVAIFYIVRYYTQRIKVNEILSSQRQQLDVQKINELRNEVKIQSLQSMVEGQEVERNRIANELHDSLGGTLSALKLQFDALQYDHQTLKKDQDYLYMNSQIDEACAEVRNIARNLKPVAMEDVGLEASVRDLVNRFKDSPIDISLFINGIDNTLVKERKLHVFRIIQELVTNAWRHSSAQEIDVQLTRSNDNIILKIEDDGIGFDFAKVKKGIGLESVSSRVNVLGGDMQIDSQENAGTSIIIHIPVDKVGENAHA